MWVGPTSSASRRTRRAARSPVLATRPVPEVAHGGRPPLEDGNASRRIVDLSLSVNPYGPPPFLGKALRRAALEADRYPDRHQVALTARLARRLRIGREETLVAGSASELLRAAIVAYGTRRRVALPFYAYEEYLRVARSMGAGVARVPMPGLRLDPARFARAIPTKGLAVLANPGTPDGHYLPPADMETIARAAERCGALLVVDESYLPFVRDAASIGRTSDSSLVVFSWSKTLGLPGLPLGHAVGSPTVLAGVRTQLLPWTVNAAARQVGLAALDADRWIARTLARVRATADTVRRRLDSESDTHYFTVDVGHAGRAVAALARRGYWVRDLTTMGLPRRLRFAVRRPEETTRFLEQLGPLLRRPPPAT